MKDLNPINAEQELERQLEQHQAQNAELIKDFDLLSEQARLDVLRITHALATQRL